MGARAGQSIPLTRSGELPADLTPVGVEGNEGANQLNDPGFYVAATKVQLSK